MYSWRQLGTVKSDGRETGVMNHHITTTSNNLTHRRRHTRAQHSENKRTKNKSLLLSTGMVFFGANGKGSPRKFSSTKRMSSKSQMYRKHSRVRRYIQYIHCTSTPRLDGSGWSVSWLAVFVCMNCEQTTAKLCRLRCM